MSKRTDFIQDINIEYNYYYRGEDGTLTPFRTAPPLELDYSEYLIIDSPLSEAIKVNGHRSRCLSLQDAWNRSFNIVDDLEPIHIVDRAPIVKERSSQVQKGKVQGRYSFRVELTDICVSALYSNPDVVINYQIGCEEFINEYRSEFGKETNLLLGKDYFFFNEDDMFHFDGFIESDKPNVIVIPNGNKGKFFDRFNFQPAYEIVKRSGGGSLNIINDVDKGTLVNFLDLSSVVVTTPSITAMECLSLGFPVLLIQTNHDQTGEFIEHGLANWYNEEVLAMLIDNVNVRKAMGEAGKKAIKNNSKKVVDIIYQEWLKKGNKNG